MLTWIWTVAYSWKAPNLFVYVQPLLYVNSFCGSHAYINKRCRPEILRMSELQDSSEVQQYSSGVLYILSSITPPPELVEPITDVFIDAVKSSKVRTFYFKSSRS